MPVEAQTVSYTYIGDGSTTAFPFPSRVLSASDILVGVNGVLQSGVVVSDISDEGATVTLPVAPVAAARVVLLRAPPFSQLVDFVSGQTVLEGTLDNALDKLTMIAQYLLLLVRGAVRVSELSGDTPPLIETPLAPGRALIVNPAGDKIIAGPSAEDIAGAQGYAQQAEDARDLAEGYRDEAEDYAALARNDWVVQQFTGDGVTTAFVLSADPGTVNNTFVTVDAVLQSKTAYSLAGTTLTLSEAPDIGVPVEVAFGFRVAVGTPADGSITKPKLAAASVDETKLDTAPARVTAMQAALGIVPSAFIHANKNAATQGSVTTAVKVTFANEVRDTAGWFDPTTNHRIQPNVPCTLQITAALYFSAGLADGDECLVMLRKNGAGTNLAYGAVRAQGTGTIQARVTFDVEFNGSTDYVEVFAQASGSAKTISGDAGGTFLQARRV